MQSQLKVHPVVLIIGVLIGATLLGFTGLLLSAPIIATAGLFGKYVHAKMFNLPPWPEPAEPSTPGDKSAAAAIPRRTPQRVRRKTTQRRLRVRPRRA